VFEKMDIDTIERELQLELEKFEYIFQNSNTEMDASPNATQWKSASLQYQGGYVPPLPRYSSYDVAMAEGDEEVRRDESHARKHGGDREKEKLLIDAQSIIAELSTRNEALKRENDSLRTRSSPMPPRENTPGKPRQDGSQYSARNAPNRSGYNEKENEQRPVISEAQAVAALTQLETVLSDTRLQFSAIQRELEIANENRARLERELSLEQLRRAAAEKERDAYASAYETSLKHFEMWNVKKQQLRSNATPRS
jgi:hypothetical protein